MNAITEQTKSEYNSGIVSNLKVVTCNHGINCLEFSPMSTS